MVARSHAAARRGQLAARCHCQLHAQKHVRGCPLRSRTLLPLLAAPPQGCCQHCCSHADAQASTVPGLLHPLQLPLPARPRAAHATASTAAPLTPAGHTGSSNARPTSGSWARCSIRRSAGYSRLHPVAAANSLASAAASCRACNQGISGAAERHRTMQLFWQLRTRLTYAPMASSTSAS